VLSRRNRTLEARTTYRSSESSPSAGFVDIVVLIRLFKHRNNSLKTLKTIFRLENRLVLLCADGYARVRTVGVSFSRWSGGVGSSHAVDCDPRDYTPSRRIGSDISRTCSPRLFARTVDGRINLVSPNFGNGRGIKPSTPPSLFSFRALPAFMVLRSLVRSNKYARTAHALRTTTQRLCVVPKMWVAHKYLHTNRVLLLDLPSAWFHIT